MTTDNLDNCVCKRCNKLISAFARNGGCACTEDELYSITERIAARLEADLGLRLRGYEDSDFGLEYNTVFDHKEIKVAKCGVLACVLSHCCVTVNVGLKDNIIYLKYDFKYGVKSGGTNGADILIKLEASTGNLVSNYERAH